MKTCATCGMPLEKKEDYALGNEEANFCAFCVNPEGSLKTGEEIFEGGVQFLLKALGGERSLAEKITRKNMSRLPYWQEHPLELLKGDMATDEEFQEAMSRL